MTLSDLPVVATTFSAPAALDHMIAQPEVSDPVPTLAPQNVGSTDIAGHITLGLPVQDHRVAEPVGMSECER